LKKQFLSSQKGTLKTYDRKVDFCKKDQNIGKYLYFRFRNRWCEVIFKNIVEINAPSCTKYNTHIFQRLYPPCLPLGETAATTPVVFSQQQEALFLLVGGGK
jgi:hypothetical protein